MDQPKIQVLVVEDSNVIRMFLTHLLNSDPEINVIGIARTGAEALRFLEQRVPDVILMDIEMPGMDGFEATRRIMEKRPVPIVICSASTDVRETTTTFRAMKAGAVACVEKPVGRSQHIGDGVAARLLETVKLMSEVKVVRRWAKREVGNGLASQPPFFTPAKGSGVRVIAIGASTGGPPVLQTILGDLPRDFAVPILIVQHIATGFLPGLIDWLNNSTPLDVRIAELGTHPQPGHVYLAPDDFHLTVDGSGSIALTKDLPVKGLRPAVSSLFQSVADTYGASAVGVLLTGMGKDGADELKRIKDIGGTTIAQDRETSVVHGMPGEAISLGGATYVLPADQIGPTLVTLVGQTQPIRGDL